MDKRKKYISPQTGVIDDCPPLLQASSSDGFYVVPPSKTSENDVFDDIELDPDDAL